MLRRVLFGLSSARKSKVLSTVVVSSAPFCSANTQSVNWHQSGSLECHGCHTQIDPSDPSVPMLSLMKCPHSDTQSHIDHVLSIDPVSGAPSAHKAELKQILMNKPDPSDNPFIYFRQFLFVYRFARDQGLSDSDYCEMVDALTAQVRALDGPSAVRVTPLRSLDGLPGVLAKDEAANIAQCHKGRHTFAMMLFLRTMLKIGRLESKTPLAVASCGNAALAAATVACAADWPLTVFIPDTANASVMERLRQLKAETVVCKRDETGGMEGDPCVIQCRSMIEEGLALPFGVQGSDNGLCIDGATTIAFELIQQVHARSKRIRSIHVQIGGGALCSSIWQGLKTAHDVLEQAQMPRLFAVQAEGNAPLKRAWDTLNERGISDVSEASQMRSELMYPWENPHSVAHGILDDETYDWLRICEGMLQTQGDCLTVSDERIEQAAQIARSNGVNACLTGSAGLAGLLDWRDLHSELPLSEDEVDIVLLTGWNRD